MPVGQQRMRDVLGLLVDGRRRLGAAVITRDGLPVVSLASRPVSDDSFSAMTAALLGAAEAALQEWSDDRPATATIEGAQLRLQVAALDEEFLLAVVSPAGSDADAAEVERAARQLRGVLRDKSAAAPASGAAQAAAPPAQARR